MCRRPPSRESGSMRSDSATWRGTVSRHDRSITVRDRSTAGMPRYSERASRISGSPSDPAASRREMKAEPPGFPSIAARRAASSSRPRETRTRPSCSIASPSATKGSYHGSGGEQVVLAFGISATGEIGADLLAGPRGAHGADDERFAGRSQGGGREDVQAPGHSLVRRDIDEAPRPEAAGLEGAREALPGRAGTPQIEKPAPEGTAGEVMGAKLDHPAGSVGGAGTGETRGRIPPPEEHLRHLAELVSRLEEAELEVPVLGPRLVPEAAHGFDRGAAEGHARVHEWRLDEAGGAALFLGDHPIEPLLEPGEPRGEGAREAAHERADGRDRRVAGERLRLQAEAIGMDEVVGVHAGDDIAPAAAEPQLQGRDQASAFAPDHHEAGVGLGRLHEDARRIVGRGVVHADDLEGRRASLREEALERDR